MREHRYQSCSDKDCERPYCRIWREAWAEGYRAGHDDGYDLGYEAGLAERPLRVEYIDVPVPVGK